MSGMRGLSVFISDIRNCQNKEQERLRVDKELGNIRTRFKNEKVRLGFFLLAIPLQLSLRAPAPSFFLSDSYARNFMSTVLRCSVVVVVVVALSWWKPSRKWK